MNYPILDISAQLNNNLPNANLILEASFDGLCLWDAISDQFVSFSPKLLDLLGYKEMTENTQGQPQVGIAQTVDLGLLRQKFLRTRASKEKYFDTIIHFRHAEGHYLKMKCTVFLIGDDKGHDTKALLANKLLKESNDNEVSELLEKVSAQLPGCLYQFRKFDDGRIDFPYTSIGIVNLYGITPEEIAADASVMYNCIHPDDQLKIEASNEKSFKTLQKWSMDFRIIVAGVGIKWIKGESTPVRVGDSVVWSGYLMDNTPYKEAEILLKKTHERFELATHAAGIGVWEYIPEEQALIWDEQMFNLYNLDSLDVKMSLDHWMSFIHPEDTILIRNAINAAIENLKGFSLSFKVVLPSGGQKSLYASVSPKKGNNGKGVVLVGIHYDITEQKNNEKELLKARQAAEAANRSKSEFLANMSHEIRTPLNGVIGFTDLLMKTRLDDTQKQYMSTVFQSANALLEIINDILDFSKIEAGKLELAIEKTDVLEVASQVADMVKYQAHQKGLEMLLNISPEVPRFVWADPIRLRQILVNLLGNAVKFTHQGEIELKIEALDINPNGQSFFRFSVRDTGIGIAEGNQQKIFDAFSQEDASTTRKFGGTGLGLTISNKLLALMDSKLGLRSQLEKGSEFYFEVYFKAEQGEPQQWDNLSRLKKILVVDDNANNRLILKEMLSLRDIESDLAKNGIEALEKMQAGNRYDVILMDYHMPFLDGLETVRNIRKTLKINGNEQPVMLLHSSSDDDFIHKACQELEIRQWMIKPIKMNQLYGLLSKLVTKPEIGHDITEDDAAGDLRRPENKIQLMVLIAEDNVVNMLLAKSIIKSLYPSSSIIEATNGKEAILHFNSVVPDIIFMDIQMPEMNGYEAAQYIRSFEKKGRIPIVALTAGTVKGEKEKCLAAGMDDYITKPVLRETIEKAIYKWVFDKTYSQPDNLAPTINEKHFDLNELRERMEDDDEIIDNLMLLSKEYLEPYPKEMEAFIKENNTKEISSMAHKLKGSALSVCFNKLALLAKALEHTDDVNTSEFRSKKKSLFDEIEVVLKIIDKHLGR